MPWAIPGLVLSLAMLWAYVRVPGPLGYGTLGVLVLFCPEQSTPALESMLAFLDLTGIYVGLYLQTLVCQDPETWGGLSELANKYLEP